MKPSGTSHRRACRGRGRTPGFIAKGTKDAQRLQRDSGFPPPEIVPAFPLRVLGARWGEPFRRPAGRREIWSRIGFWQEAKAWRR